MIVGFIILSWQLRRQHLNTLDANRRQSEDRLKVELYNKIAERIEATAAPLREVALLPTAFMGELIVRKSASRDTAAPLKSTYFAELDKAHQEASNTVTGLMSILETHEIVMPEFTAFLKSLTEGLRGMNVGVNDFRQAALPFAGSDALPVFRWPPSDDDEKILSGLAGAAQWATVSLVGIVRDLRGDAQNALLGALFPGRRVPPRVPTDPSVKVTRVDV